MKIFVVLMLNANETMEPDHWTMYRPEYIISSHLMIFETCVTFHAHLNTQYWSFTHKLNHPPPALSFMHTINHPLTALFFMHILPTLV